MHFRKRHERRPLGLASNESFHLYAARGVHSRNEESGLFDSPTWPSSEGRNAQHWPADSSPIGHRWSHEPPRHSVLHFPSMLPARICVTAEYLCEPLRQENRSASSNNRWPLNPEL